MKQEDAYKFISEPHPPPKGTMMAPVGVRKCGFEWALTQLRNGHKVQRTGWNGKDMYITLQAGYPHGIPINQNTAEATGIDQGTVCRFSPYIMMKTADTEMPTFVPWLASQTDILALDWCYYIQQHALPGYDDATTGVHKEVVDEKA